MNYENDGGGDYGSGGGDDGDDYVPSGDGGDYSCSGTTDVNRPQDAAFSSSQRPLTLLVACGIQTVTVTLAHPGSTYDQITGCMTSPESSLGVNELA